LAKNLTDQLIEAAKKQLELDEKLAKEIQGSMYAEYVPIPIPKHPNAKYKQFNNKLTPKYNPIKPPTMKELLEQTDENQNSEKISGDSISCLICHQPLKEYIILPGCLTPHIYCIPCAGKMTKQGGNINPMNYRRLHGKLKEVNNTQTQTIQCVLCSKVSTIDPIGGLKSLRRKRKRADSERPDHCLEHNEEYQMFCMDDQELICYSCAGGAHARHNYEALDVATTKVLSEIQKQLHTADNKKNNLNAFVSSVHDEKEKLNTNYENACKEAREKFRQTRELLEAKEKEVLEGIEKLQKQRFKHLESELTKAQERIQLIDAT